MTVSARRLISAAALWSLLAAGIQAQPAEPNKDWDVLPTWPAVELPNVMPNTPVLVKSLGDAAEYLLRWQPPVNRAAWDKRRPEVERALRKSLGLETLPERTPLDARITAQHDFGDYTVDNLMFEGRPGFPVTANLYRLKAPADGRRPAILNPIGHYLGAGKTASDVQARCIKLARMGFVVLVYDAIGQGERLVRGNVHHDAGYALLPLGETIAGWMVWDSMRAIDYLLTRPDVDPHRIGVTGNSGGGLNTLLTAALDPRVSAAVVVGFTFEFNNWLKYGGTHCTCTHFPGVFRAMEWFEIAGLIAPRPLMMLQGGNDNIFPISGARRAAHNAIGIYKLLGKPEQARFNELPGQPHAYSRPYREDMYGWMARHLLGGNSQPISEGELTLLPEKDSRLLCDPDGSVLPRSFSVVDLARRRGLEAIARLPQERRESVAQWVRELTSPPETLPHFLAAHTNQGTAVPGGVLEKLSFVSEDGEFIPGLIWRPEHPASPARVIVIVDERGKAAVAQSGLVPPLLETGYTVFSVDLRGRGETLGRIKPGWDTNFRLVANQVLFGAPLAGRRAFDLTRALDYLAVRKDLAAAEVTIVGLGDDALPALLAAAADARIQRIAVAGYLHSFVSQMKALAPAEKNAMPHLWNSPQLNGHVNSGDDEVDFGSVIPAALLTADIPEIASLIAPRRVLFCQARDSRLTDAELLSTRFRRITESTGSQWIDFRPNAAFDAKVLLDWLRKN